MHLGMAYDVAEGSFPIHRMKKPFFIFEVPEMGFFVKQPPN
jgi:hypothetical protein